MFCAYKIQLSSLALLQSHVLDVLKVGEGAGQDVDLGVDLPGHALQHYDVGEQGGELPLQLHFVLADDCHHVVEEIHAGEVEVVVLVEHLEDPVQLLQIGIVVAGVCLGELGALVAGEVVDHLGALLAPALDHRLDEAHEGLLVPFLQLDDHPSVEHVDDDPLPLLAPQLADLGLLPTVVEVDLLEVVGVDRLGLDPQLEHLGEVAEGVPDLGEEVVLGLLHGNEDVAPVTVGVDEVVLHQHLEEGFRPLPGYDLVERVPVRLVERDGDALDETLHQHLLLGALHEGLRELHVLVALEHPVECLQVPHFCGEVQLVGEGLFQRLVTDGDLVGRRQVGGRLAQHEHQVDVPLNVHVHPRVPHLHCHLLPLVPGLIDLAHRARRNRHRVNVVEDLLDVLAVAFLEQLAGGGVGVGGYLLSEVAELGRQFGADDVPPVAEVLEGLDEDHSCALHRFDEHVHPKLLGALEHQQRREQYGRGEYQHQLKEPRDVQKGIPHLRYDSLGFADCHLSSDRLQVDRLFLLNVKVGWQHSVDCSSHQRQPCPSPETTLVEALFEGVSCCRSIVFHVDLEPAKHHYQLFLC